MGRFDSPSVFTAPIQYSPGAVNLYILTSDASGNASWQPAPASASPTPTAIDAGETYTIAEGTQMLWHNGISVGGSIVLNGSLQFI